MSFFPESRSRSLGLYSIIGQNAKCKKKNCGEREKEGGGEGQDHGCTPKIRKVCPCKSVAGEEFGMEQIVLKSV